VGFYHTALTKQLRGSKDRKSYVLAPTEVDLEASDKIMDAFRGRMARAEAATGRTWADDPACYLTDEEIAGA